MRDPPPVLRLNRGDFGPKDGRQADRGRGIAPGGPAGGTQGRRGAGSRPHLPLAAADANRGRQGRAEAKSAARARGRLEATPDTHAPRRARARARNGGGQTTPGAAAPAQHKATGPADE